MIPLSGWSTFYLPTLLAWTCPARISIIVRRPWSIFDYRIGSIGHLTFQFLFEVPPHLPPGDLVNYANELLRNYH